MNHSQVTPEEAALLAANPEAAAGSAEPDSSDKPDRSDRSDMSDESDLSDSSAAGGAAEEVPFAPAADSDEVPPAPTFLAFRRHSFWPDDFTL